MLSRALEPGEDLGDGLVAVRPAAERAFNAINAERVAENLRPLDWDEGLYGSAVERARQVWEMKWFGHQMPGGRSLIPCACGEVLSASSDRGDPVRRENPAHGWLHQSPAHRAVLLAATAREGAVAALRVPLSFEVANSGGGEATIRVQPDGLTTIVVGLMRG